MYIHFTIENHDHIGSIYIWSRPLAREFEWNNTGKYLFLVHGELF